MTESDLRKEVKDGEDARMVLENPAYLRAIGEVEKQIIARLADSPMGDEKTQNKLVIALQLCKQINNQLRSQMETGSMARLQLDDSRVQRLKKAVGF